MKKHRNIAFRKRLLGSMVLLCCAGFAFAQVQTAGSSGDDFLSATDVAADGAVYAAGTYGAAFQLGGNAIANSGGADFLLMKADSDGVLQWSASGGSFLDEEAADVAAHPQGGVVCAGAFWFTAQFGNLSLQAVQNPKALFLIRYTNEGQLQWGRAIDGGALKEARSIAIAGDGSIFLSGFFQGQLIFGTDTTLLANGETDFFLAKFTASGQLLWALNCGGQRDTRGVALAIDHASGDVVATGFYNKEAQFGSQTLVANTSDKDVFVARFNTQGQVLWARRAGGVHDDQVSGVAIDSQGDIYLTGYFIGVINLAEGFSIQSQNGIPDFYLIRYAPDGTPLLARSMGSALQEQSSDIVVHGEAIVVSGYFEGNLNIDGASISAGAGFRGFLATFSTELLLYHLKAISGTGNNTVSALAANTSGQLWLAGSFQNTIQLNANTYVATAASDGFLARFDQVVSTNKPLPQGAILVFPNPTGDTCFLKTPWTEYDVTLFDAVGHQVFRKKNAQELFLGSYPSGQYTLVVRSREGQALRKIIVP